MTVSDNGSNKVKAIYLLNDCHEKQQTTEGDKQNDNSTQEKDDTSNTNYVIRNFKFKATGLKKKKTI